MARLSGFEITDRLKNLRRWELDGEVIKKKYEFASFTEAIQFVNKVANLAEQVDHHPDIFISYRRVTLTLSTHSEGGITQKDFNLAECIDREKQS